MLTKSDIADIISERLWPQPAGRSGAGASSSAGASGNKPAAGPARVPAASRPLPKRVFISDWELRRMVKAGQKTVMVPANAIISPLSEDWLDYDGITVVRAASQTA